jgi:glutathione S-transferase
VGVIILNNNELTEVKETQITRAKDVITKVAKALDDRLKLNTFLVGDSLSIADISAYFSWNEVSNSLEKEAKHFLSLHRWANHIASIPLK